MYNHVGHYADTESDNKTVHKLKTLQISVISMTHALTPSYERNYMLLIIKVGIRTEVRIRGC